MYVSVMCDKWNITYFLFLILIVEENNRVGNYLGCPLKTICGRISRFRITFKLLRIWVKLNIIENIELG